MLKKPTHKINRIFLKNDYPENILFLKLSDKKSKQILQEKSKIISLQKRIKKAEQQIIKRHLIVQLRIIKGIKYKIANKHFKMKELNFRINKNLMYLLFSIDQVKKELSRKRVQYKPSSSYLLQLKERKKISILYGNISKSFFRNIYNQARKNQGKINENICIFLERRLDIVLQRICFFKTIMSARQSINHNYILVNGKIVNTPSYQVKAGDIISLVPKKRNKIQTSLLNNLKAKIYKRRSRYIITPPFLRFATTHRYSLYSRTESKSWFSTNPNHFHKKVISFIQQNLASLSRQSEGFKEDLQRKKNIYKPFYQNSKIDLLQAKSKIEKLQTIKDTDPYGLQIQKSKARIKKLLRKFRSRRHKIAAMLISPMKPINLEISYKTLTAIFLYSPQKIAYPCTIDFDLLYRSLN